MEPMASEGEESSQPEHTAIIPGLPDDIALSFVARVPREYHSTLSCVSKRWKELVCGEEWYSYRVKHHLEETWVYALCRDRSQQLCLYVLDPNQLKKGWSRIHGIPNRCIRRRGVGFEVLGKKLYLCGGSGWIEDATDEVYCYDATLNTWTQASPLSTARCYFACQALHGKIYSIGGLGSKSSIPHSWDAYDAQIDRWSSHEDPNVIPDIEDSVVWNGKIYIRCGSSFISSYVYAVVYESSSGTWQHADSDMACGWHGPAVAVDGVFYVLDQTSGLKLMMWQKNSREWASVGRLSTHLVQPPCQLVAIAKKIYVIGTGLSTVVIDVENAGHMDGVLVGSSVLKSNSDQVISCKCLAI